ncbi:sugar ABC transporter substrate-binding protein [Streptomyces sp. NBC_01808]|uniref:sugar ABC transporter substrate-binding protein n=1 Tax=Streptomyces sp. NBC_01808 TaxID=2975947 RepID=UPI002DDA91DE|nr:sugar ABC transporter substrate-binding protein [Streptomyces sp. NBC_01808]WSA37212.1 sugar ABC transporter substrate-binding protein [Streptomyces sp. NBC_01808]
MRKFVIGAVSAAMVLGLAACGSDSDDGDGGGDALDGKGKTLDVWIMKGTNPDAEPFFDKLNKEFEKKTGAKVNVEYQQWESAQRKFTTAIEGGPDQVPDVAEVGTTWVPQFAETGGLVDVTDQVKDAGLDQDLVEGLKDAGTLEGKQYGMPWYAGVRGLVYRKDIFDKHGLKAPTTWEELRDVALTLKKEEPDMISFPVAGGAEMFAMPFVWGAGGEPAVQDGDTWKSAINSPESVEGLQFYTDLATKDKLSPAKVTTWREDEVAQEFTKGNVAMTISGNWTPKTFLDEAPELEGKIAAAPIPGKDGGMSPSFLGGSYLSTFDSDKKELAWEYVKMATTGKFAAEWAKQTNYFPGTNTELKKIADEGDPLVEPFAKQMLEAGATVPKTTAYGEIQASQVVLKLVQSVLKGDQSVQEAADKAAGEMDDIFAKSE